MQKTFEFHGTPVIQRKGGITTERYPTGAVHIGYAIVGFGVPAVVYTLVESPFYGSLIDKYTKEGKTIIKVDGEEQKNATIIRREIGLS